MLKFFRKIRHRLLNENNFSKYLLYAFGEIALVMIGILLALQVNNWNHFRKDRKLAITYLERMIIEVTQDTTILNQKMRLGEKLSKQYLHFIREMYEKQESKEDFIQLMGSVELNVDELILIDIAYSELVNTGKLDLIFNKNLKNQITNYYRDYEFISSRTNELNESTLSNINAASIAWPNMKYVIRSYMELLPAHIFATDDYMFDDSEWTLINSPKSMEFRLYENAIYFYYMKQNLLIPMYKNLAVKAENLLDLIKVEIEE